MSPAELIAALEAADAPSRELDAEAIFNLYAKPVGVSTIDGGPKGYLWPEDNPSWNLGLRFPGKDRDWFKKVRRDPDQETILIERDGALVLANALRIPRLTASIDASETLKLPEFNIEIRSFPYGYHVIVMSQNDGSMFMGKHKHEAMARDIAWLKARQQ